MPAALVLACPGYAALATGRMPGDRDLAVRVVVRRRRGCGQYLSDGELLSSW